ncbi:MAG: hypothetical protein U0Q16_18030 [Bryobacteraceae bacterium]
MPKTIAVVGLVLCALGGYGLHVHWDAQPGATVPARLADEGYRRLWQGQVKGPGGAIESFQQALAADAGSPYRWADLGAAFLEGGEKQNAQYCFEQARLRSPRSPQILIRSANFALAIGDEVALLSQTGLLLELVSTYDEHAFRLWQQADIPVEKALATSVKSNRRAHESLLRFLIRNRDLTGAGIVWEKLPNPGAELTADYAEAQVEGGNPTLAAGAHHRDGGQPALLVNGGFESEWSGKGLDWRVIPIEGVSVERRSEGTGHVLEVAFNTVDNIEYKHTGQRLWIPSGGAYRLQARMRSENLTTDQGVALRVLDGTTEVLLTPPLSGSSPWHEVQARLTAAGPRLLRLEVYRPRSWKFDGKPRGRVWIDDVRIEPST